MAPCIAAISPDGKIFAAAHGPIRGLAAILTILDIPFNSIREQINFRTGPCITAVAFSPCVKFLVSGDAVGRMAVWSVKRYGSNIEIDTVARIEGSSGPIHGLKFFSDSRRVTIGYDDKTCIADIDSRTITKIIFHQPGVTGCALSPDEQSVAVCYAKRPIMIYDLSRPFGHTTAQREPGQESERKMLSLEYNNDGTLILACGEHSATLWDTQTMRRVAALTGMCGLTQATFCPDGKYILTCSSHVATWMAHAPFHCLSAIQFATNGTLGAFLCPDGKTMATTNGKNVHKYEIHARERLTWSARFLLGRVCFYFRPSIRYAKYILGF